MDQPTGDAANRPAKNRPPLFIGAGLAAALMVGGGLYYESTGEVGKIEPLKQDKSELGELRGRTLKEIADFETELRVMTDEQAHVFRVRVAAVRQSALKAESMPEMMRASAELKSIRDMLKK